MQSLKAITSIQTIGASSARRVVSQFFSQPSVLRSVSHDVQSIRNFRWTPAQFTAFHTTMIRRPALPIMTTTMQIPSVCSPTRSHSHRPADSACLSSSSADSSSSVPPVEGMPRYPDASPMGVLRGLDYLGTLVFACTGSMTAASVGMDLFGCMILGTITAVGGGTIRDAIVLHKRPFWSDGESEYLLMSLVAAALAFFLWPKLVDAGLSEDDFWLFLLDAIGVGAFCVIGAKNGIRAGMHPVISIICGIMTATFGGVVRDTLAQRPVRILHSHAEIYATTAGWGAAAFVAARSMGLPLWLRLNIGFWTAVGLRFVAWTKNVSLPTWDKIGAGHLVRKVK